MYYFLYPKIHRAAWSTQLPPSLECQLSLNPHPRVSDHSSKVYFVTRILGDEIGTIHSRKELNELLKIHVEHGAIDVETGREVAGVMNYKEHTVREVMTPIKDCFMLSVEEKLNFKVRSNSICVLWSVDLASI